MQRISNPLLLLLLTGSTKDLINQMQYLKIENSILRSKLPKIVPLTDAERRRLIRYGKKLGTALKWLITIVTHRTFSRWLKQIDGSSAKVKRPAGRPATPIDIRELILKLAAKHGWGYTRILGELKKLGITVARSTVKKILLEHGYDPGSQRGHGSWTEFIHRHAETLWACDFLSVKTWTCRGATEVFVLFFIHVQSRRVIVTGLTEHPDDTWMAQQARNLAVLWADEAVKPKYLILDNDTKFSKHVNALLEADDVRCVRTSIRSPNMNAITERWVQTLKTECLDHFICFGERHLRYIISRVVMFYNTFRPHQGRSNLTLPEAINLDQEELILKFPTGEVEKLTTVEFPTVGEIKRHSFLGGLLNHYERVAA